MKRMALILAALLLAAAFIPVFAQDAPYELPRGREKEEPVYMNSGLYSEPKLTPDEIVALFSSLPNVVEYTGQCYEVEPSLTAPYTTGVVKAELIDAAMQRLNALRAVAGLKSVALDAELTDICQHGAVLLAAHGSLSHFPPKPEDMDDEFYQIGYQATSSSNLASGIFALPGIADVFMSDSDASNISAVGHRMHQLDPGWGKTGFGRVSSNQYGYYIVEHSFDRSATYGDYDFISWPASGYFPKDIGAFGKNTAWCAALNPNKYQYPVKSEVTVTLRCELTGQEWVFSGQNSYTPAGSGLYFNVSGRTIIFRPDNIAAYGGRFTVSISGIKDSSGEAAELNYYVDFVSISPEQAISSDVLGMGGSEITFTTGTDYPFVPGTDGDRSVAVSTNSGVANSVSYLDAELVMHAGDRLFYEYRFGVGSDSDNLRIDVNGGYYSTSAADSFDWTLGSYTAAADGIYRFRWQYVKYSAGSGNDYMMMDNIRVVHPGDPEPTLPSILTQEIPAEYVCAAGIDAVCRTGGEYPFIPVDQNGFKYAMAGNTGVESSYSVLEVTMHLGEGEGVSFYFNLMRATTADQLRFYVNGERKMTIGFDTGVFTYFTTPLFTAPSDGDYTLRFMYFKQPGDAVNTNERCMIRNIYVIPAPTPTPTPTPAPTPTPDPRVIGDVNCDGIVDSADLTLAAAFAMSAGEVSEQGILNGDMNSDGLLTAADLSALYSLIQG